MEKHIIDPLIKNIGKDIATRDGKSYRVSTIEINMPFLGHFETAINCEPIEKYHNKKDAIAGHKRYVKLIREGWIPKL